MYYGAIHLPHAFRGQYDLFFVVYSSYFLCQVRLNLSPNKRWRDFREAARHELWVSDGEQEKVFEAAVAYPMAAFELCCFRAGKVIKKTAITGWCNFDDGKICRRLEIARVSSKVETG